VRLACLDASSGISGDLFLGALVDAGVPLGILQSAVDGLGVEGLRLTAARTSRGGVAATKVDVTYPPQDEHRHLRQIVALIAGSSLDGAVKERAIAVFGRLAEVEAAVHGVDVEHVHFHEVGAADAIADVVGSVAGLHHLGAQRLLVGSINVGSGHVSCAHGVLAVPAPATAGLLEGWTYHVAGPARELTTPTGAALVTTLGFQVESLPEMRVTMSGYGAGGTDPSGWPNVLHLSVGEATSSRRRPGTVPGAGDA
jgi:uncharacterized protein (TIGR00299 family) protein